MSGQAALQPRGRAICRATPRADLRAADSRRSAGRSRAAGSAGCSRACPRSMFTAHAEPSSIAQRLERVGERVSRSRARQRRRSRARSARDRLGDAGPSASLRKGTTSKAEKRTPTCSPGTSARMPSTISRTKRVRFSRLPAVAARPVARREQLVPEVAVAVLDVDEVEAGALRELGGAHEVARSAGRARRRSRADARVNRRSSSGWWRRSSGSGRSLSFGLRSGRSA